MSGRSDLVGRAAREVFVDLAGQRMYEVLDEVYSSGTAANLREWRIQLVDEQGQPFEFFLDADVFPRLNPDGSVLGIMAFTGDATQRVLDRRAARTAAAEAERRYEQARDVLVALQRELLPPGLPVLPGVTIGGSYLLADADTAAGGDWFDALALPDGRVALTVGDVVGHGVAASATMGQLRAVLSHALAAGADITAAMIAVDEMAGRTTAAHEPRLCASWCSTRPAGHSSTAPPGTHPRCCCPPTANPASSRSPVRARLAPARRSRWAPIGSTATTSCCCTRTASWSVPGGP